jgi:hypothetical protein
MKQLKFRISPDGAKVEVEGVGFTGKKCLENDLTKGVIKALGQTEDSKKKAEYYSPVGSGAKVRG